MDSKAEKNKSAFKHSTTLHKTTYKLPAQVAYSGFSMMFSSHPLLFPWYKKMLPSVNKPSSQKPAWQEI